MIGRRKFLSLLGLAPLAVPVAMAAAKAQSAYGVGGECFIGTTEPLVYGSVLNATTNYEGDLVYKVSDRPLSELSAVRDGGVPLVIDGDEPSTGALKQADIAPGHVRTCMAEGTLRLGAIPAFVVTADAVGAEVYPSHTHQAHEHARAAAA
jgi:hypothetical protein